MPFFHLGLGAAGLHMAFLGGYPIGSDLLVCRVLNRTIWWLVFEVEDSTGGGSRAVFIAVRPLGPPYDHAAGESRRSEHLQEEWVAV